MDKTEQANSFLNIIRSIINEEQNKLDRVEICQIDSVNEDGTVNIKMLSDFETIRIIPNISNQSIYSFKSGDLAIIYMIQNQLSNAFIIAKCGPTNESLRISSSDGNTTGDGTVIQNITYQNVTASGVTSINGKTGEVTITAQDLGAITEIPDVTQIQSTDISSIVYDTTNGAAFEINNSIIFSDGTENNSLLKFNLPIIGINGISIDKANGKNVLEISGKDLQDLINSISLTSGTNNGTLKLTVGTTIVDNIKVTGFDQKQDQLSTSQLNAVNSGITSGKVSIYDGYQAEIDAKYTKPTGGIPKDNLASDVQASLGKADTALQSHQSITTGSANGTISVDGSDVAVKGLKALAYKDSLTKTDVGLGNVNNTSDAEKPISTATQAALNTKQDSLTTTQLNAVNSGITSTKVETYDGYAETLANKLDKTGGTISGSLTITQDLIVNGTTSTVEAQNLKVADKLIYIAKDNTVALTSPAGLITPKYDGTNNGGIVYDNTGTAYVGDIALDSNGNVDVNSSDLQPIATRNAVITDGNIVKWDDTKKTLVDSSKKVSDFIQTTGGTMTGKLVAPQIETGTDSGNYFQCSKFRGQGDANTYYHAIDFGYAGHDRVDFHEYGGLFNFYRNTAGTADGGQLIGSITDRGFVGGAELTGTPTAPTAAKGTNTTQIANTEFVQSAVSEINNEKVNYGDALLTTSPFGGKHLYISKIDNAFYSADKRWIVSGKLYDAETDEYKGDIGSISNLFDGNYDSLITIPSGQYAIITIDFSSTSSGYMDAGYPYGDILISFYDIRIPASLTARAYCNFEAHGIGWHDLTGSYFNGNASSTANVIYKFRNNSYAISTFEFKIYSKSDSICSPVQIEMNLDRPDPSKTPVLSKYRPETLYYPLTCPEFKGSLTGTATNATNDGNGNTITSTYIKELSTSGQTITYTKGDGSTGTITTQDTTYSSGTHININGTTIDALWPTASDSGYAGINKTGTVTGVKVNGTTKSPTDGIVDIGSVPSVVQTTGASTENVMSQNSVTNELGKKADLFVRETGISQISSGKSYELGSVSSMTNFPTINASEFTSINDVSQICFKASANFVINMPSTTYLCIGDGLSSDKTKLTTVSGKSYCITVGYTPFGIQIVSAIVDVL